MWKKRKSSTTFTFNGEKVFLAASQTLGTVFSYFQTSRIGLTQEEVEARQSLYGKNEVEHEQKKNPVSTFIKAFINPFIGVLTALAIISFVLDVFAGQSRRTGLDCHHNYSDYGYCQQRYCVSGKNGKPMPPVKLY